MQGFLTEASDGVCMRVGVINEGSKNSARIKKKAS